MFGHVVDGVGEVVLVVVSKFIVAGESEVEKVIGTGTGEMSMLCGVNVMSKSLLWRNVHHALEAMLSSRESKSRVPFVSMCGGVQHRFCHMCSSDQM